MPTKVEAPKSEIPRREGSLRQQLTLLAVFLLAIVIWLVPPPVGVEPKGWHLLAIFVSTIVGIILKLLPMG